MDSPISTDLEGVARRLNLNVQAVRTTAELLDEGNTVPFITRYRKDQTDGLDEEQIRAVQDAVAKLRLLEERKQTIRKSIQSQEKLTPELAARIDGATTLKFLEDLYLPYKPRKQTLATIARQRGLEPLFREILDADSACLDLTTRCAQSVDPDRELHSVDDVLEGVRHLVAENFSERADLRSLCRRLMWRGELTAKRIEPPKESETGDAVPSDDSTSKVVETNTNATSQESDTPSSEVGAAIEESIGDSPTSAAAGPEDVPADSVEAQGVCGSAELLADTGSSVCDTPAVDSASPPAGQTAETPADNSAGNGVAAEATAPDAVSQHTTSAATTSMTSSAVPEGGADSATDLDRQVSTVPTPATSSEAKTKTADRTTAEKVLSLVEQKRQQRREARRRKRRKLEQSFRDYFDYKEPLKKLMHHRILALNRGDRAKVLRVKIAFENEQLRKESETLLIPSGHPHAEFLKGCLADSLSRLVVPSIEREIRRELTDRSESHAVNVFARNLRNLLLQPPLRGRRMLAIDPGFRSGCKLVAIDEFGNLLGHNLIHVVGSEDRKKSSRERLIEELKKHSIDVVVIGNGTGCRETEQLCADVIGNELKDTNLAYLIVNEAGASVYSTSPIGREELPAFDATVRGAVSIGRRAIDPLSELVKIDPASIGVGLYQHDVKAKHLQSSLDAVVESCVNYVGVDVNSASPSLLSYVSGLNQLTARRLFEHRQQHGPFRNREQLKEVPGIGEATFVQSAGFLKVTNGDNPLDGTWIHPESYQIAQRVLEAIDCDLAELQTGSKSVSPSVDQTADDAAAESADDDHVRPAPDADAEISVTDLPSSDTVIASVSQGETTENTERSIKPPAESIGSTGGASLTAANGNSVHSEPSDHNNNATATHPAVDPAGTASAPASPVTQPAVNSSATASTNGLEAKLDQINIDEIAERLDVGKLLLQDILVSLSRPGRDPREDLPPPIFRREITKLEDLKPGMELMATVLNVVDFGAFVDIGLSESGLVHVSRLADRFVSDPHEVVSVGDVLRVWVVEVDDKRRRVSLTAIQPGTEKPKPAKQQRPRNRPKSPKRSANKAANKTKSDRKPNPRKSQPARRPKKPVVPITQAMVEGKEAMRTFSDLHQFFQKKRTEEEPDDK